MIDAVGIGRKHIKTRAKLAILTSLMLLSGAPISPALCWEYKFISGCKLFAVRLADDQIVPVIDDHGQLVVAGSSACAPAGDHVEFSRPTGRYSIHVDGIYPATGRTWHADMRLPFDWQRSGRQPQLQVFHRDRR